MDGISSDVNKRLRELLNGNTDVHIVEEFDIPIYKKQISKHKKTNLVMSGGGVKGISYIGVLKALEDTGVIKDINTFAGTSVGSLILSMYYIGYTSEELKKFVQIFDLDRLKALNFMNMLQSYGLDTGNKLEYMLKRLITAKGFSENITLKSLHNITNKKLIMVTTCMNSMESVYLSYETFPELPLYLAVRMSLSIPLFYTPVIYNNRTYIDGGCIDNYPIHIFKDDLQSTVGILLVDQNQYVEKIDNIETFIVRMMGCFYTGYNYNAIAGYEKNTITITLHNVGVLDYDMDCEKKEKLIDQGYNAVIEFFS